MKRLLPVFALIAVALAAANLAVAQGNSFVGTWKLNVAKSKFDPGPAPQAQMRTWDESGRVSVEGTNAAGKPMSYSYMVNGDGKDYPTSKTVPNGADLASSKRINPNTMEVNFTRAGKHVETATFMTSKDGKTLTLTAKGVSPAGVAFTNVTVWEKQ